jgi:hypothetical protein
MHEKQTARDKAHGLEDSFKYTRKLRAKMDKQKGM